MYQPIKISLQVPKELDGSPQANLTMRPPETNDVILAQKQSRIIVEGNMLDDNAEHEAHLFANLTNTTRDFIGSKLDIADTTFTANKGERKGNSCVMPHFICTFLCVL